MTDAFPDDDGYVAYGSNCSVGSSREREAGQRATHLSVLKNRDGHGTGLVAKSSADNSRLLEQCVHRRCNLRTLQWFDAPWYPRKAIAAGDTPGTATAIQVRSLQTVQAARRS